MLTRNCSDFSRDVLNLYFPRTFHRALFPDVGVTTPKLIAHQLARYARGHPEIHLTVIEIPQVPGYRRQNRHNKNIAESLSTTLYVAPLALISPYLLGGIVVDYVVRGLYHMDTKNSSVAGPDNLAALTMRPASNENAGSDGAQVPGAAPGASLEKQTIVGADSGLKESPAARE